jgi:hypothetical protein
LGVSFNPYLTTKRTADAWLAKQQANDTKLGLKTHSNWFITQEDLDNNANTPDDVIIYDRAGNPQIVSGYSLNSGNGGRRAAVMYSQYPNRRYASFLGKQMKEHENTRLFNRWLENQSRNAQSIVPYNEQWVKSWTDTYEKNNPTWYNNPENMQPYLRLSIFVHNTVKAHVQGATKEHYYNFRVQEIVSQI